MMVAYMAKRPPAGDMIYLATTAQEEYWDVSRQIVFLGEWCRRYSRKEQWAKLDADVLEGLWLDDQDVRDACDYVQDVYERLLPFLADALNRLHGVRHTTRYWRILLGPWLLLYVPVVYDRFLAISRALEHYPELTTTVLAEESWVTPADTLEFVQFIKDDPYNLQIYSRIFRLLGRDFPSKACTVEAIPFVACSAMSWKDRLKGIARRMIVARATQNGRCDGILLRASYFSLAVQLQLFLKSRGHVFPLIGELPQHEPPERDLLLRRELAGMAAGGNDFDQLLLDMLPFDIPRCFVEGYAEVVKSGEAFYPPRPKAIFSSVAWHYDESFKQWAAASAQRGTLLLGMQHGGNYGSLAHHSSESHEIAIIDRYFSWGWHSAAAAERVVPRNAAKLAGRRPVPADNTKDGILFVATAMPRYLLQFPYVPERFDFYLTWQFRFAGQLQPALLKGMRVRLHREDMGWDMDKRWQEQYPEVFRESWDVVFQESLENCRLYVCDQLATTFLEALSANKPSVLFWNPEHNELRPEAEPYYEGLRAAGILYDSPEAAAEAVNMVYGDVESWWNDPQRQRVRSEFCDRFARTSATAVDDWANEFRAIASMAQDSWLAA